MYLVTCSDLALEAISEGASIVLLESFTRKANTTTMDCATLAAGFWSIILLVLVVAPEFAHE